MDRWDDHYRAAGHLFSTVWEDFMNGRVLSSCVMAATMWLTMSCEADARDGVKIGLLTALNGPAALNGGESNVEVFKMAIDDFGGQVLGQPIQTVVADHSNKPDVGLSIAREWFDVQGVDAIVDINNSAVALAVSKLAKEKGKLILVGATSNDLIGKLCSPNTTVWYPLSDGLAKVGVEPAIKAGGDKWFFLTIDYNSGHVMEQMASDVVKKEGGSVVGVARFPFETTDFGSFLLQAQAAGANTLGLASWGTANTNIIKQAKEFGLKFRIVPFVMDVIDVDAAGLSSFDNVSGPIPFYWDRNEQTRAWSERFKKRFGRVPSLSNEYVYSATTHYLQAVKAAGTADATAVAAKMRELPVKDDAGSDGSVREDGRVAKDLYSYTVKSEQESKGRWDDLKITSTVKADDAFLPLSQSECPLVKK
jgi:branched-chain amino acid transport system substrate-binding protein